MTWSSVAIRRQFIEFYKLKPSNANGHAFVPSSPVVPHDDPTLLFANAGMNQFKKIFLGQADRGSELGKLKRAVNSQKCIRAGGKHNDLEDVGHDTYHHTFFEMLGNWSFGDYFKAESIAWGWELLTNVYGIDPSRLYATYFGGNEAAGLKPDEEARDIWLTFLPPSHVLPGNMKDNFWEMGDTGPCGPCSEIHYDRVGEEERGRDAAHLVNTGDPMVIEIWNHVFIQFNREEGGALRPLPAKHVDTGMGFERLTSVLQNVNSNYDTDIFAPIFQAIERATGVRPYMGRLGASDTDKVDTAYRVIADHIRTLTFALTDGAVPSNVGRGYVLRRILRRAVRYGRQMLGAKNGFFANLVPVVAQHMGEAFPELRRNPDKVAAIILEEEESFGRTLDRGIKLFEDVAKKAATKTISGPDAFKLYDTYGFPIDLTALMAQERGLAVDMAGYEAERKKAEELSRAGGQGEGGEKPLALSADAVASLHKLNIATTEDWAKFDSKNLSAKVVAIYNGDNFDEHVRGSQLLGKAVAIILDKTNFYAEMGGQEADHGRLNTIGETRNTGVTDARGLGTDTHIGGEFRVEDVKVFAGYVLHIGHLMRGEIRVGDRVMAHVDRSRRGPIQANHTATHLMNLGLRNTLGDHVDQKGSLVAPDRLRFDFTNAGPVAPEQIASVEAIVRDAIRSDLPVFAQLAHLSEAKQVNGVRAVFGETYPDPVRVVSIGVPAADLLANPTNERWRSVSVEFCGGTHVARTSEIGPFTIIAEEAVAKGVRRLVALTGVPAEAALQAGEASAARVRALGTLPDDRLASELNEVSAELDQLTMPLTRRAELRALLAAQQERVKALAKKAAAGRADEAIKKARQIADTSAATLEETIVASIDMPDDRQALLAAVKLVRDKCPKSAVMLVGVDHEQDKLSIAAAIPEGLVARGLKAGDWVRDACAACGGKGGGKPDSAQGGGAGVGNLKAVLEAGRAYTYRILK
ncbi:MAG: alanine--tRNA ligase [Planctomycetota bacterium]|nr:alanine--tRNA ligase [Planctomycetota bacterium]